MELSLREKLKHYRLSEFEYERMCELLKRNPKDIEWPLFSALWSEHCSYKSSRIHLRQFAQTLTPEVVNASGENAGIIDLGEGEKIAFKMESHNHPSYIEPYQGAATGVGGILRDIFTMGARPIALADYLCFGSPEAPRMPSIVDGVVRGIGGYGNSVGVPTITGHTEFASEYNQNVLVNAMAVGLLLKSDPIALSAVRGPGNWVVYVGAKTGKDGVHGASMASESFGNDSSHKKPNVQIGDPFFEKLLIESCLQVISEKLVVAIQDMGAAGLTSSSFEMAAKGGLGLKIDLSKVPLRDSSMTPEEILLSESQERMLLICKPDNFARIQEIFQTWHLDAVVIGEVLDSREMHLVWKGETLTVIDPALIVDQAPVYERPYTPLPELTNLRIAGEDSPNRESLSESLRTLHHSSREAIYSQYDQRVGYKTVRGCESDIGVLRLPLSHRALAVAVGCRPWLMKLSPRLGARDSVFYPALQMAIKGFRLKALTDCLNFGNPERPEVMAQFVASVEEISKASQALRAPVISGNVSFYNETLGKNIISTPAIGAVGIRPDWQDIPEDQFLPQQSAVFLIHLSEKQISSGSVQELAEVVESWVQLSLATRPLSAQMVSRGGLVLSLGKMTLSGVGFEFSIPREKLPFDPWKNFLYAALMQISTNEVEKFLQFCMQKNISICELGSVRGDDLVILEQEKYAAAELKKIHDSSLRGIIETLA
jgi:phosphoribosylformylglycinamidine synthase II